MSNELAEINLGGDADISLLAKTTQQEATVSSGNPFIKLSQNTGEWSFGAENEEVTDEDLWFPILDTFKVGYVERIQRTYGTSVLGNPSSPPDISDLKPSLNVNDKDYVVVPCYQIDLACVEGDLIGQTVTYSAANKGGINAVGRLINDIQVFRQNNPGSKAVCVFSMQSTQDRKNPDRRYPRFVTTYWDDKSLTATKNRREDAEVPQIEEQKVVEKEVNPKPLMCQ